MKGWLGRRRHCKGQVSIVSGSGSNAKPSKPRLNRETHYLVPDGYESPPRRLGPAER
jgi:hypothetical protein